MTDTIQGTIDGYNHEGMGILRLGQEVVFIPGALDGEKVKARITQEKKARVAWAELTEILSPSPHRQTALCPHSSRCGGCHLQHASYTHQLAIKQAIIQRAMAPLRKEDAAVLSKIDPIIPAIEPRGYRNKGIFAIGQTRNNRNGSPRADIGFYARHSRDIAGHGCPVLFSHGVNALLDDLSLWLGGKAVFAASTDPDAIDAPHHLLVRESRTTGKIILIFACEEEPRWIPAFLSAFTLATRDRLYDLSGVGWLSVKKSKARLSGKPKTIWGSLVIQEELYPNPLPVEQAIGIATSLRIRISPEAFFQVNTAQANVLYREALKACNLSGGEVIWDLYCGSGTIGLFLSCRAKAVLGIDIAEASIYDAWINAWENADASSNSPLYERLCFLSGAAEKLIPLIGRQAGFLSETVKNQRKLYTSQNGDVCPPSNELVRLLSGNSPDIIILDPPARGADNGVLDAILSVKPGRILYISCDPATLARDLRILIQSGIYRIDHILPLDMFPQTAHVETLVLLSALHAKQ